MPGFWYEETTYSVDQNFKKINDIANYLKLINNLNHQSSILIFNKIPKSQNIEKRLIEKWIFQSVEKAKQKNIRGKDLTPFLINEINQYKSPFTYLDGIILGITNKIGKIKVNNTVIINRIPSSE